VAQKVNCEKLGHAMHACRHTLCEAHKEICDFFAKILDGAG